MIDPRFNALAESMLGWPYLDLGRDAQGIDCLGVVLYFYREAQGIDMPDPASGSAADVLSSEFYAHWNAVEPGGEADGDIARFTAGAKEHLGILLGRNVLHAARRGGVIVTPVARLRPSGYHRHRSFGAC